MMLIVLMLGGCIQILLGNGLMGMFVLVSILDLMKIYQMLKKISRLFKSHLIKTILFDEV